MAWTQPPSRSNSAWSIPQTTKANTPADGMSENEKDAERYGRIVGGKHVEEHAENDADADWGIVKQIEGLDIPLTLTEMVHENDKDYIVLKFATGDRVSGLVELVVQL
jgi:hypothetical protein